MGNEDDIRIEDYMKALKTIDVDVENEYFTVEDNVLYSLDMKTLYMYPPGKTDTYFLVPDTVINLKKSYMGNSSLQELEKAFGPLDTPYRDSDDFFYSFTDGLSSLKIITVDVDNPYLSTEKGVLYEMSSDYIVVGRPITAAENVVEAYRRCVKEL